MLISILDNIMSKSTMLFTDVLLVALSPSEIQNLVKAILNLDEYTTLKHNTCDINYNIDLLFTWDNAPAPRDNYWVDIYKKINYYADCHDIIIKGQTYAEVREACYEFYLTCMM